MWGKRLMWIAWPAFLMAGIVEMLIFAVVDPESMHWFGRPLQFSRESVYALAFFVFWIIIMTSSALTVLLSISASEMNRKPLLGTRIN